MLTIHDRVLQWVGQQKRSRRLSQSKGFPQLASHVGLRKRSGRDGGHEFTTSEQGPPSPTVGLAGLPGVSLEVTPDGFKFR